MIVYISDSLNSKKNGGSSTSGFDFLQFLRIYYKDVVLITSDTIYFDKLGNEFYGNKLNPISTIIELRRKIPIVDYTIRSILRPFYYFFQDLGKKRSVDLDKFYTVGGANLIYVNSWSAIFSSNSVKNTSRFSSICIVRGSPESFIYQSFEEDKKVAVINGANYLENFNKLIYVSNNGLKDWSKILKNKIESYYLPNSINEEEVNKISKISPKHACDILEFNDTFYNIVIVGSVQTRKAQNILLKVAKYFLEIKPNIKFHIVGVISKTWGGTDIYKEICKSPYSSNFIFHGHSDDALLYMQAADLLIFTSYAEAFPRTVAEYMSFGKPILAADVSGVNEMICDGENGYLYDPHNPLSLVNAFMKMESNQNEKFRLSKNASNTYWNHFSKRNHISKAIEIFKKIGNE
jgi:glycosyltransferase involved in cell wall biosynthesis